ncbi:MAG: hypothetical protein PHF16_03390 [Atribacterota bacterium]|nr:hypothetical protein [Atribacterota bacterium]
MNKKGFNRLDNSGFKKSEILSVLFNPRLISSWAIIGSREN